MTKTKINFRPLKALKRRTGCLDPKTGVVINAKDKIVRNIKDIEKHDIVGYFETRKNGKIIQKSGRFKV